ncbi:sensor histidine kinase [Dietzia sp. UBA5065]|uniref:sensor histidine kinase n=2 Tax=Dietzia TaxID=37914 RepID=UPI0025C24918|nr:HAMP domain-containing sensor histidine kinase [Dietzia sp. UBA5065]
MTPDTRGTEVRRPGPLDRLPLRVLLVGTMLLLVAAGLLVSGAAVALTMRAQLVERVDDQLADGVRSWAHRGTPDARPTAPSRQPRSGQPSRERPPSQFYVEERAADGTVLLVVDDIGARPAVPADLPPGEPRTVPSAGGGAWRVLATPARGGVVVLGLPLDRQVDRTVGLLVGVSAAVGAGVLLVVGTAGWYLVRRALRPLGQVSEAAGQIAAGDLDRRLPERPAGTEVGDLTRSFNEMIDRIQIAFTERAASEARSRRFAADAGHELRTPLTSIRGFAELHRMGAMEDAEEVLARIDVESTRMADIVEDLLTLAGLDERRPIARTPVDVAEVVSDAVEGVRALAPDRSVTLDVRAVPVISGDASRLGQVFSNLVVNAVRHTPAIARVWVEVDEEDDGGGAGFVAVVRVRDDGPGMGPEDAARAFERFHRADDSRTRADGGGSGLGLSIVSELVHAHGGTVELDTAPGAGATFTVRFPQEDAPTR